MKGFKTGNQLSSNLVFHVTLAYYSTVLLEFKSIYIFFFYFVLLYTIAVLALLITVYVPKMTALLKVSKYQPSMTCNFSLKNRSICLLELDKWLTTEQVGSTQGLFYEKSIRNILFFHPPLYKIRSVGGVMAMKGWIFNEFSM